MLPTVLGLQSWVAHGYASLVAYKPNIRALVRLLLILELGKHTPSLPNIKNDSFKADLF